VFTVIETPTFVRLAADCWNDEDRTDFITFITFIASNPDPAMSCQDREACEKFVADVPVAASAAGCE
jgi:hypothetical protein